MKKDKAVTEKLLQETIEKNEIELAAQKEFYTNALNAAKEAEALAEARANDAAKIELESRLREANEREHELARSLHQLRQTLIKTQEEVLWFKSWCSNVPVITNAWLPGSILPLFNWDRISAECLTHLLSTTL